MNPRVRGAPAVAGFLSREARGRPSDLDPMAEGNVTVSGPDLAQEGRGAGLVWRSGHRLLGRRPERRARRAGWADFAPGPPQQ